MARRRSVTVGDVRAIASTLPRSYEVFIRGRVKFRVGQLVYVAFSRDEAIMEFAFAKDLRDALVDSDPEKFLPPSASDLRFNWVGVRLAAVDREEAYALVVNAWKMCVPKKVAAEHDREQAPMKPAKPNPRR